MKEFLDIVERIIRKLLVYPVLRLLFRNRYSDAPLNLQDVRRILILRNDRIGDMIVTTPILRSLKHRNPELRIDVIASRINKEILRGNPYVDQVYVLETGYRKLIAQVWQMRRLHYDVVLNFVFNRTTSPAILANIIAPKGFKVGQGPDRYSFYFNRLLKLPRFERHMVETLAFFAEQAFGIRLGGEELAMEVVVAEDSKQKMNAFLSSHRLQTRTEGDGNLSRYIVLNLSVKDAERKFSKEQAVALARKLSSMSQFKTVLLIAPGDEETEILVLNNKDFASCIVYRTEGEFPLGQLASLVQGAVAGVTMDTSIVHFASATGTPVLAFYTELSLVKEWAPFGVTHDILMAPMSRTIAGIPTEILVERATEFIQAILSEPHKEIRRQA